jgi:hypothetical protein
MKCPIGMLTHFSAIMIIIVLAASLSAQQPGEIDSGVDLEGAKQVKDYYADWLSSIPGVAGVTVASSDRGEPEIKIEAAQMTPRIKQIPGKLNGIPVVITGPGLPESGPFSPSSEPLAGRGLMPSPTPEAEIRPSPTPSHNKFWPANTYPERP